MITIQSKRRNKWLVTSYVFGNTDGLLHISKISHHRVDKVEDVLKLGDIIDVKVTEIDNKGRINVSAKALLPKPKTEEEKTEA